MWKSGMRRDWEFGQRVPLLGPSISNATRDDRVTV